MTIYRLYQQNGHRAGFWVQHRTWGNTCGRVVSIAGRDAGPLPGAPPRHDEAAIVMQLFDVRSGRTLEHADQRGSDLATWDDEKKVVEDIVAADQSPSLDLADRQYASIAEPFWHAHAREQG